MTGAQLPDPASGQATPGALAPSPELRARQALRARELALDLARARQLSRFGAPVWAGFAVYDLLQARRPAVGHLSELLLLRALGVLFLLGLAVWVRRSTSSSRLRFELRMTFTGVLLNACLSLMCLYDGGFTSLYSPGIVLVMFALASVPRPLRRGLRINTLVVLPYPLVMCAAAVFSPGHAALLRDPSAITAAVQFHFTVLATSTCVAVLGHALWSSRRELLLNERLARYRLLRALGQGPLGEVWLAHHHGLRRDVAVKLLHRREAQDASAAHRFELTMQGLAAFAHPNVARIHDFGFSEDDRCYYVTELLEGESLSALVQREGGLDLKRATRLVLQIARALAEAHARGIVHKNLKPENVFVGGKSAEPELVKLLDFGFASPAPGPRGHEGTPAADVYALGALFFLLLTGERVAQGEALGQRERVPSPSARLGAALPDRLESLIVRCLESDPSERFRDGRELASAIDACLPLLDPAGLALGEVPRALARSGGAPSNDEQIPGDATYVQDQDDVERLLRAGPLAADDTDTALSR